MFVMGSSGTGKSYIATALGYRVCQKGLKVLYANTSRLLGQLKATKVNGSILEEQKKLERTDMLIQDDFGLQPLDNGSRMHLMDIIEDQYGKKSTLITSQLPVKDRYDVIGKETIAGAVMNRITHLAVRIELHGESIRKICGKK